MIGELVGTVGEAVEIKGYAQNYRAPIAAMQFSADEGDTWTTYPTTGAEQDRNVNWSFTFTPAASGHYRLLVRAVGGDGRITPEPALVHLSVSEASRAPRELL